MSTVVVWVVDLDDPVLARSASSLSPAERTRADRFRCSHERRRWIAAHVALRALLGEATGTPPQQLRFTANDAGKPRLLSPRSTGVTFNLSHSGAFGVVAVTRGQDIGVDVERRGRHLATELATSRFLAAAERRAILDAPPHRREEAFLRCWTAKEAYVKARGSGLLRDTATFAVETPLDGPPRLATDDCDPCAATRWRLVELLVPAGAVGTACVPASARVVVRRFDGGAQPQHGVVSAKAEGVRERVAQA